MCYKFDLKRNSLLSLFIPPERNLVIVISIRSTSPFRPTIVCGKSIIKSIQNLSLSVLVKIRLVFNRELSTDFREQNLSSN